MKVTAAVLGASILVCADGALAAGTQSTTGSSRLDLSYEAPADCPSLSDVEAQLRARVPEQWLRGADGRRFRIVVVQDASGSFSGRLEILRASRPPQIREIRAETCDAVGTALAVFLALALDPKEQEATTPRPAAPVATPERPIPRPRPSRSAAASWMWTAAFDMRLQRTPAAAWGGRVYAEVARLPARGIVAPAARLSWGWNDFSLHPARSGEAEFRTRTVRLEGCARVTVAPFTVSPCALYEIGSLRGAAPEAPRTFQRTIPWSAAGALVRLSWRVLPWCSLELDAGLLVPFERTRFVLLEPRREVYRPPPVMFEAGLGVGANARF